MQAFQKGNGHDPYYEAVGQPGRA